MSGISVIFIMDNKGRVIIHRSYRGDVPYNIYETFNRKILEYDENNIKPVIHDGEGNVFIYINYQDLTFLAITKNDSNCLMVMTFL